MFPEAMMEGNADRAACRALLRTGSRTFFAAAHLLPRNVREPATALYAFCRLADDAVDEGAPGSNGEAGERAAALARLRTRLDRVYAGRPLPRPADRAFAAVVEAHAIPRALPDALLDGLGWDVAGWRYATLDELHGYAARVAGSVGVMMALVMGVRDEAALTHAAALGAAMQLTNIARDVGEDARAGRLYLPLSWLRADGLDPDAWLAAPAPHPAVRAATRRLLAEADRLYRVGEGGIPSLPRACRPGIRAAGLLYAAIGREVARAGFDGVTGRARVSTPRKLALLAAAARPRFAAPAPTACDLPAAGFLVACVGAGPARRRPSPGEYAGWVLQLFERIEQRRRLGIGARSEVA